MLSRNRYLFSTFSTNEPRRANSIRWPPLSVVVKWLAPNSKRLKFKFTWNKIKRVKRARKTDNRKSKGASEYVNKIERYREIEREREKERERKRESEREGNPRLRSLLILSSNNRLAFQVVLLNSRIISFYSTVCAYRHTSPHTSPHTHTHTHTHTCASKHTFRCMN